MGFLENILNKARKKAVRDTAEKVLTSHILNASRHPELSRKELFRVILEERYCILKTMKPWDIENLVVKTDNLVELTLAIIAYENPPAIYINTEETINIVSDFFERNAIEEFKKFKNMADIPYAFLIAHDKMMTK